MSGARDVGRGVMSENSMIAIVVVATCAVMLLGFGISEWSKVEQARAACEAEDTP